MNLDECATQRTVVSSFIRKKFVHSPYMINKIVSLLVTQLSAPRNLFLSGAILFALFQVPLTISPAPANSFLPQTPQLSVVEAASIPEVSLKSIFLGNAVPENIADKMITEKMAFVSSRKAYPASLSVVKKHANTIKAVALKNNVPEDVALGVALLENGGSETAVSSAGALGVFQLMPGTARALGLTVSKGVDQRKNPKLNIEAGIRYLRSNYDRFGDWGLATWAYHAGEGNVTKAIQLYAKANHGVILPGVKEPAKDKAYVAKHGITIHKLLSSNAVKTMTKKLNDDSAGYPYKVIATANLFKASGKSASTLPGVIVVER